MNDVISPLASCWELLSGAVLRFVVQDPIKPDVGSLKHLSLVRYHRIFSHNLTQTFTITYLLQTFQTRPFV